MGAVVPQMLSIRAVDWQSYAVAVQFIDENEQSINPGDVQNIPDQLDGGTISEYAPKSLLGNNGTTYDFVGAYVGNNEIEFAGSRVSSEGANTYYAVDTDSGIASLLQPGQTIVLRYQTHVDRHAITYRVTGIDDSEGLVSGATSVKTGESVDFTVANVYGYTVRVSSNGSELTGDNGVYTLNSVMDNTTVEVAYTANTTYDFTISDEVRGTGKDDGSTNAHGMIDYDELPNQPGINVGEDLTFTIQTIRGQAGANWYLDSLEIENQTVSLPRTYNEGDSATTYLDNGLVVEVVLTSVETRYWVEGDWWNPFDQGHWEEGFPEYTYTVTVSGAKDDVEMTFINFVGSSHHEVMPHFDSEAVVVTYNGSQHGTAQNEKPIQTTGGAVNFYLDIQPGYELTGVTLDNAPIKANHDGAYRVENMSTVVKHLDISTRPIAYSVQYNMNGVDGTAPSDGTQYGLALEKNLVVGNAPETDSGKVFLGWKLGNETYQPGTVLNVEDILDAADAESRTIAFTAEWGDSIVDGKPVMVYVDVLLQNADGNYVRSDELSTQELAYGGDVVTVRDPMAYLKDAVDYTFNDDKTKDFIVLEGDNNRIELYFDLNKAAYTVNYFIEGTTDKVPGIDPNPVTGTGYVGQVVAIDHPTLTTGYKVCEDQPTELTVTNDEGKNVAIVYYDVDQEQTFGYEVKFLDRQTGQPVADSQTGEGYVNQVIDVSAPEVPGYTVDPDAPKTLTVTNDEGKNVAIVYYDVDLSNFHITSGDQSWMYDGTTRRISFEGVYPGDTLTYDFGDDKVVTATVADDGTIQNEPDFKDVTDSATVKVAVTRGSETSDPAEATMTISRRTVVLTSGSDSKVYDGTALTNSDVTVAGDGFVQGEGVQYTFTGSQIAVGTSDNTFKYTLNANTLNANYDIDTVPGTLTVTPQSITPGPDPDNPDPSYNDVTVDYPENVPYDGTEHTWVPTVTDADDNVLVAKRDYTVSYSTTDRTNVTGTITVTITGIGNFAGTVTRTYQVVPRPLVVQANDQTKVQGAADPALSSGYNPAQLVADEEPGWTGGLTREAGEAVGTYAITQGTLALEDNGDFLAANYVLTVLPGTLTITAAPAPDNPPATTDDGGDDTPTTPAGPTNPVPDDTLPVTDAADDATTDDATPEETVTDDENPLASGDEEGIEDNGNPLASGRGDEDCWVHWLILVGMILTAVYFVGVAVRRRKFTADLLDYEDKVLGNNRNDA